MVNKSWSRPGRLIAFEGPDGCGKSTQAKIFFDLLHNKKKIMLTEPTQSGLGRWIRKELSNKRDQLSNMELQLLFIANRREYMDEVERKLDDGYDIVMDRFTPGTIVYGAAKGLGMKRMIELNKRAGIIDPYVIFYLKIPVEDAMARLSKRTGKKRERFEDLKTQRVVHRNYDRLARMQKEWWVRVDGSGSIKETASSVRAVWDKISKRA
ncbi:MAG: dTMP kinase [Candidatus Micrarchaeota archaeon]|nr:dTMP kinase [Candidatus Micrarchaeota archaeon]